MKNINITRVKKRDGLIVPFDEGKIVDAIYKAGKAQKAYDLKEAKRLVSIVISLLQKTIKKGTTPEVEKIQDIVEQVIMAAGYYGVAKAYILYRDAHSKKRNAHKILGVEEDLGFSVNALKVIERRYLRHNEKGESTETPRQMFERVAQAIARVDRSYGVRSLAVNQRTEEFYELMVSRSFVPGGCYFRGAGTRSGQLANCFVLPVKDSMESIFDAVKWTALIHKTGGGTGFNFSELRPRGDHVKGSQGFSSGPVSFMKVFDAATRQVGQGGFQRGANMGILNVDHPDILEFITCKQEEGEITNFNISIGITDAFMNAVLSKKSYDLVNPRNGEVVSQLDALVVWHQIVSLAWRTGDPGLIFLDTINYDNPVLETLGPILSTNVCGEQPLHPFDVCNLGSINLAVMKSQAGGGIDFKKLKRVTQSAVRFLDNGVDASKYPILQIHKMAKANRRIGLGVMGFADLLYQLEISYNSAKGVALGQEIMRFINQVAHEASKELALEKGVFPNWYGSRFEKAHQKMRNVAVTTIAPTGTISMVADCSSGVEPVFALSFIKNVVDDAGLLYLNTYFEKTAKDAGFYSEDLMHEIARLGTVKGNKRVPQKYQRIFVTAHDVDPSWHVKMQAGFQKYTDNAVSKTINFPKSATIEEVENAFIMAWKLGCKGITIYRDGSKSEQILHHSETKQNPGRAVIQSKIKHKPLAVFNA